MSNRRRIKQRVIDSAEKTLQAKHYVSAIDVFVGSGVLQINHVQDWKKGKIPYLEKVIEGSLGKISYSMKCFRVWASGKGLKPRQTIYLAKTKGPKRHLRFSKFGDPQIELAYRTHYISPVLREQKKARLQERAAIQDSLETQAVDE